MRLTWCLRPSWSVSSIRERREPPNRRRRGAPVVELDAVGERAQRLVGRLPLDVGHVDLGHLVARMSEPVGEARRRS